MHSVFPAALLQLELQCVGFDFVSSFFSRTMTEKFEVLLMRCSWRNSSVHRMFCWCH